MALFDTAGLKVASGDTTSPNDINDFVDAVLTAFNNATATVTTFTNADLSSGILTCAHDRGTKYVKVLVWKDDDTLIEVETTAATTITCTVDLSAYGTISGTWRYRVI